MTCTINSTNQQYSPRFSSNRYITNRKVANINTLEKTPDSDTVSITSSKKNKLLIGGGALVATALLTAIGVNKFQINRLNKAQKAFQDFFMRDNISIEETKQMLSKYKDLRKIKDKEEYIKALAEETRKNFGLGNKLIFELKKFPNQTMGGGNFCLTDTIMFNTSWSRNKLENAVFHELRHAKQDYLAINYDVEKFFEMNGVTDIEGKKHILPFLERKCGLKSTEFSKANVPDQYKDFTEKCLDSYKKNRELLFEPEGPEKYKKYRDLFIEKDAWNSANNMTKLLYNFVL